MKKKGQRTFNNENVHRIKMLGLSSVLSMAAGHLSSARKSYWQLARFQKLCSKWDKMSHFSEFVKASKAFSDHVTRNASAVHNNASSETQGQIKGARESLNGRKNIYGTKKSKKRREELFSPFFTFLRATFFRPFRLSLVPTICPWVSEDDNNEA